MLISYISKQNLAEIIRQSKGRIESNSFAIVDVRDDDYVVSRRERKHTQHNVPFNLIWSFEGREDKGFFVEAI